MQADWQAFLVRRGAVIEAGLDAQSAAQSTARARVYDLSGQGVLSVLGDDAQTFLQSQLSNDVVELVRGACHLTSYSSPQGRMLGIMRAFRAHDAFHFLLPLELVEPVRARLSRYVLRARVQLDNDSDKLGRVALGGAGAQALLAPLGLPAPQTPGTVANEAEVSVLNLPFAQPCYIVVAPFTRIMRFWEQAEAEAQPAGGSAWRLLQIDAGIPTVYPATSERFVPQMVNLEILGGVNFTKGCYAGQEIIARTQHLGRIKRRMFRFACAGDTPPQPGDAVVTGDGTEVGTLVDAAAAGPAWRMLAVIAAEALALRLHHAVADGAVLEHLDLPYDIDFTRGQQ